MAAEPKKDTEHYDSSIDLSESEEAQGLATTYKQITDAYTVGTIDGVSDDVNGTDRPLNSKK